MSAEPFILEARKASKCYRPGTAREVWALREVSVCVPRGSFTVLAGPSGSGKTTLLALLGALERPTSGQLLANGTDLAVCSDSERARLRRRFGFVFQDFALIPTLPVWENITYPLIPRAVKRGERLTRAQTWMSKFGLEDKLHARPQDLSGGEQQRVALARALIGEPEVLLLDEPTSNLDSAAVQWVAELLETWHSAGKTVLAASHDLRVRELATQTYALDRGRIR